jgi:hypothetical protein
MAAPAQRVVLGGGALAARLRGAVGAEHGDLAGDPVRAVLGDFDRGLAGAVPVDLPLASVPSIA